MKISLILFLLLHLSKEENIDDIIPIEILIHHNSGEIGKIVQKREAIAGGVWPNNTFVYNFAQEEFRASQVRKIKCAITDLAKFTCVKFVERKGERTFVQFRNKNQRCTAAVGYFPLEKAIDLFLGGPGCQTIGTVQHEILHALGLGHEHTRADRDEHVAIIWSNIAKGREFNFEIKASPTLGLPYDYSSVLHYRPNAFSKDGDSLTILPKSPNAFKMMGQRRRFSRIDLAKLNRLYNCPSDRFYTGEDLNGNK